MHRFHPDANPVGRLVAWKGRGTAIALAATLALAGVGCAKSPSRVYEAMEEAAREGNAAEFASHFTEESRPFAEALISLYATEGAAEGPVPSSLALLARSTVESERIESDRAFVSIRAPAEQGGQLHTLVFRKQEGAWKLDIADTERENAGRD